MISLPPDVDVGQLVAVLRTDGCAVVEGLMPEADLNFARAEMKRLTADTPRGANDFVGRETKRVFALFAKTRAFDAAAVHPLLLGVLDRLLGHYHFCAPVGIAVGPGETEQAIHRDQDIYPIDTGEELVLNTMWALDDFTAENGATRVVPRSHKMSSRPRRADTVPAEMKAGSVLFYLGSLWHGAGANTTSAERVGVILEYVVSWLRQQENHSLAVPRDVVRGLPERLQELLGYNLHPPFLGFVDGRHPRTVLQLEHEDPI